MDQVIERPTQCTELYQLKWFKNMMRMEQESQETGMTSEGPLERTRGRNDEVTRTLNEYGIFWSKNISQNGET